MIHQVILGKWVADKCNVALQENYRIDSVEYLCKTNQIFL